MLPLRRQNEWKMNLTESLQGTHDVHKALITAGKKTKSTIATGIESVVHKSQNHAMTDQEDKQFAEDNQKPIKNGIVVTSKSNAEIEPQGRIRDNNYMKQRIVDTKHLESIKYNENVKFYSGKELLLHETDRGQQKLVQEYYNESVIKVNDIQNMNNKNFAKSAFVKPTETKNNDVLQPLPINIGKEVRTLEENATPIKTAIKAKQPPQKAKIDPPTRSMPDLDLPPTTANTEMLNTGNQMLILSYMRSGSSMNGNVFKDTEDDFYVYEPLIKFAPYHYFTENRFCMMRMSKCT